MITDDDAMLWWQERTRHPTNYIHKLQMLLVCGWQTLPGLAHTPNGIVLNNNKVFVKFRLYFHVTCVMAWHTNRQHSQFKICEASHKNWKYNVFIMSCKVAQTFHLILFVGISSVSLIILVHFLSARAKDAPFCLCKQTQTELWNVPFLCCIFHACACRCNNLISWVD